jgi:16S rRNA (guanine527-N7)-methyltransferase
VAAHLAAVLERARSHGFLGPGAIEAHVRHSLDFARVVDRPPVRAVDLGSGAGVPGLILAIHWPDSTWLLLDANQRRSRFLDAAVGVLHLGDRVQVRCQRAEHAGRDVALRGMADLVTARGFGPPGVTAECAAPLLTTGGTLVVAEPPGGDPQRWPAGPLLQLGLVPAVQIAEPSAFQGLRQKEPCPERFPRRTGIPAKRPLF